MLEERAADLYVAIDRAAHRVRKKIARQVKWAYPPLHFDFKWRSRGGDCL